VTRLYIDARVKAVALRSVCLGLLVFVGALVLFLTVGGLRLWPRISGQRLPFSLIWPFARPLLAVALELSFLVSVPVALGLSASTRAARHEGGASWRLSLGATCLLVGCLGALSFGVSASLDSDSTSPGQLASELVGSARQSCVESAPPAEVSVPLLGFSWVCEARHAPRLHGRAPVGKQAEFEASAIQLGDDLKRISLAHFALAFSTPSFPVHVRAEHATLSGLPPWGRSRRIPFGLRSCLFLVSVGLGGYGVARLAARWPGLPAWGGVMLGASVSGCLTYLALPAAGLVGVGSVALTTMLGRRLWQRWVRARRAVPEL
jgi:hypothetical protein